MKKRFLKSKPVCKVTFELPAQAANGAARGDDRGRIQRLGFRHYPDEARQGTAPTASLSTCPATGNTSSGT